jgi:three-Cys-motif partner protein
VGSIKTIKIYDLFAGIGKSDDGDEGSALIAAKAIKELRNSGNSKQNIKFELFVNDYDTASAEDLKTHLREYLFAEVSNLKANQFIEQKLPKPLKIGYDVNEFFFIDPYGYTQISKQNLEAILKRSRSEFLIFIPTNHIYRFVKGDRVLKFLTDLDINSQEVDKNISEKSLSSLLLDALKKISGKEWGCNIPLKNQNSNNRYGLFFISGHKLGAYKFLEVREELKAQKPHQYDFIEEENISKVIIDIIGDKGIDNIKFVENLIKRGIFPPKAKDNLKKLEENGKITVTSISGNVRRAGSYYLDYKNKDEKVIYKNSQSS